MNEFSISMEISKTQLHKKKEDGGIRQYTKQETKYQRNYKFKNILLFFKHFCDVGTPTHLNSEVKSHELLRITLAVI